MKTLRIEELSKNFGTTEVLRKINLEIDEGNFLVLLGPSGFGKSTLLNIIAGLETINEGNVFIDDYNVSKVEPNRKSFQIWVNCHITVTTIIGADIGSKILKNILKKPAPSILAALTNSVGIET